MTKTTAPPTREQFARWVHDALKRLYDSVYLQTHPLGALLGDGEGNSLLHRSESLRRILLQAIQTLQPKAGTPASSPDWRAYNILELRFIEGLGAGEVADQLGLSQSQLFRDQATVLEALTEALWERYLRLKAQPPPVVRVDGAAREEALRLETERISASGKRQLLDLGALLADLQPMLDRLANAKGKAVRLTLASATLSLVADRVMLRQAVLNLVSHALDIGVSGQIEVGVFGAPQQAGVRLATTVSASAYREADTALEPCARLMQAMGGRLETRCERGRWQAKLVWPLLESQVLLVVDDNKGLIELFQRYLADHGWQVVGATSGAEARQVLAHIRPTVIVMDVMMPHEDGWDLLAVCKADTSLGDIPVVVCSVLNQPQLALAMGATAFLPKPVTQTALLRALAPLRSKDANSASAH